MFLVNYMFLGIKRFDWIILYTNEKKNTTILCNVSICQLALFLRFHEILRIFAEIGLHEITCFSRIISSAAKVF